MLEGCGAKLGAYAGCKRAIDEVSDFFDRVETLIGSSGGAMAAGLLLAGYTGDELNDILIKTDFTQLVPAVNQWGVHNLWNLYNYCGMCSMDALHVWYGEKLQAKLGNADISFIQIYERTKKYLIIPVTNISKEGVDRLEWKWTGTDPTLPIRDAIIASACQPPVFMPRIIGVDVYIDAGTLNNLPLDFPGLKNCDPHRILAFRFSNDDLDAAGGDLTNGLEYLVRVYTYMRQRLEVQTLTTVEAKNCVMATIVTNVSGTNFKLTDEEKKQLDSAGYDATKLVLPQFS